MTMQAIVEIVLWALFSAAIGAISAVYLAHLIERWRR